MNRKHKNKLIAIIASVISLGIAAGLILYALKQNINLFYTPTQLLQTTFNPKQTLRVGGYVKNGSLHFDNSGENVNFIVTDKTHELNIEYHGLLPNLFREEQTVVITGKLADSQHLLASEVLAKHDEKYMPKVLSSALVKTNKESLYAS